MVTERSKKISTTIFLFAIFVVLAVFTGGWLYNTYTEQIAFSESSSDATVKCGKYYFDVDPDSVYYENKTLHLDIENTFGAELKTIIIDAGEERKEVNVGGIPSGTIYPVSVEISIVESVLVYPSGCETANFKKLTFEPAVNNS